MSWTEFPLDGTTAMLLDQIAPTPDPFDQLERIGAWEKVTDARSLVEDFPATFAALQTGLITLAKSRVITEGCTDLSAAAAAETRVPPRAPRQTTRQLRAAVARAVKREDGAAAEHRRERRQRERAVVLHPERDGIATLSATLPAAEARRNVRGTRPARPRLRQR